DSVHAEVIDWCAAGDVEDVVAAEKEIVECRLVAGLEVTIGFQCGNAESGPGLAGVLIAYRVEAGDGAACQQIDHAVTVGEAGAVDRQGQLFAVKTLEDELR